LYCTRYDSFSVLTAMASAVASRRVVTWIAVTELVGVEHGGRSDSVSGDNV
jgi:hypothetical protein